MWNCLFTFSLHIREFWYNFSFPLSFFQIFFSRFFVLIFRFHFLFFRRQFRRLYFGLKKWCIWKIYAIALGILMVSMHRYLRKKWWNFIMMFPCTTGPLHSKATWKCAWTKDQDGKKILIFVSFSFGLSLRVSKDFILGFKAMCCMSLPNKIPKILHWIRANNIQCILMTFSFLSISFFHLLLSLAPSFNVFCGLSRSPSLSHTSLLL